MGHTEGGGADGRHRGGQKKTETKQSVLVLVKKR